MNAFALIESAGELAEFQVGRCLVLHNLPESLLVTIEDACCGANDELVLHLHHSIVPVVMTAEDHASAFLISGQAESAVAVPLHTPTGRRYAFVGLGGAAAIDNQSLAMIAYEAMRIFQRYFEALLSLDLMTGLSDREIQIVRWTSQGKTSAEMAIILGLSEHTVNSYTAAIIRKLHVVNRAQMVATALRAGLIS